MNRFLCLNIVFVRKWSFSQQFLLQSPLKQARCSNFCAYHPVESHIYSSFSQGSLCMKLKSSPSVCISANWAAAICFPAMTKTAHHWLASLHHGYQTHGSVWYLGVWMLNIQEVDSFGKRNKNNTYTTPIFHPRGTKHAEGVQPAVPSCLPWLVLSLITAMQLGSVVLRRNRLSCRGFIYAYGCTLRSVVVFVFIVVVGLFVYNPTHHLKLFIVF